MFQLEGIQSGLRLGSGNPTQLLRPLQAAVEAFYPALRLGMPDTAPVEP